jgi:hypothetical protein
MHIGYEYQLHRATMPRSGEGDLWLNYEGQPKISLQGVAQSPKFGKGILALQPPKLWSKPLIIHLTATSCNRLVERLPIYD